MVANPDGCTPEIEYPCAWTYRLIGASEKRIRELVGGLLGDREHSLDPSRTSSGGRYVSMKLTTTVRDDRQRLTLYRRLAEDPAIRYVL